MAELVRTACTRDCPDACGIVATVENGRVLRIQGDPEHPVTRGFLCQRTNGFVAERQYDPERLTAPLLRRGGDFTPISWDAALDLAAEKLLRFRAESGPASICHYRSGGSLAISKVLVDYFFELFGPVTIKRGDICSGAGEAAQELDFGLYHSNDFFDLLNARTIVLWGKNPYASNVHLLPVLREAKQRGARIVLVDPVHHRTTALCDLYLQPRPGGDFDLAMGVARVLFERGWTDPEAASYCDHLEEFRALARSRSLADWARRADVAAARIEELAEAYGRVSPAAIQVGWGMQRRANGAGAIRALDALCAVSGNLGVPGGGVSFSFPRRKPFETGFVRGLAAAPRSIPEPLLGPGLLAAADPPIRMLWITAGNPVAMLPESHTVAAALHSREFTVVVDSFLTDSAKCAHLVLPVTTMLEEDDLVGSYGHSWISEVRPVVAPPPGVKSDLEIVQALAPRVGLGAALAGGPRYWKERFLARIAPQGASLEALARGAVRDPEAPQVLFPGRRVATANGRVQLLQDEAAAIPAPTPDYPLYLMSISTERAQASQTRSAEQQRPMAARVHPAAANGYADGAVVRLRSRIAAIEVRLVHDDRQRRDLVVVEKGGWLGRGRCANALIRAALTDRGEGAAYYDECVRLDPLS